MKFRKIVRKEIDHDSDGVRVAGAVNAVVAANVNEPGTHTRVSSRQRIVQKNGKTTVTEEHEEGEVE